MLRKDREIKEFDEIAALLNRCDTIRLGLNGEKHPYIVPLSFGMEVKEGKITVYFHGAKRGYKHELILRDSHACIEADFCHGFARDDTSATTMYESVIGFGNVEIIEGDEAVHGLEVLLSHCGFEGLEVDRNLMRATMVYKVTLESVTGKRHE